MSKNGPILEIKKRKSKLEIALSEAKNRIQISCVFMELYEIELVKWLLGHPVDAAVRAQGNSSNKGQHESPSGEGAVERRLTVQKQFYWGGWYAVPPALMSTAELIKTINIFELDCLRTAVNSERK